MIATRLDLSENTIKKHTSHIYSGTGVRNRRGLARFFFQNDVFRVIKPILPFYLEQHDCEFLTEVSYGIKNDPAAEALALTTDADRCVEESGQ